MYDVLIIGAGVIGCSIARELSKYNPRIGIIEARADVAMGSTKANSAIVHGGYAESNNKLKGRLCYQGRRQFAALNKELNFGFKPIGSFVLAFEESQRAELEAILKNGIENGVDDLEIIEREQLLEMEPCLNPDVICGLYCKGAGVCSPYELAIACAENAIANGAEFFFNSPVSAIVKKEEIFTITAGTSTYKTRYIVNAAGLYADKIAALIGAANFSIHPRSGEYLLLNKDSGELVNHVLFQMPTKMGKGILVSPTVYGSLILGPDASDEDKIDLDTHADRLYKIYKSALQTTKQIDIQRFLRSYSGARAVSSTDDYIIEESSVKGFVQAAGIQSPGIASSPAIAQMVCDILKNAGLKLAKNSNFKPNRKATHTPHPNLSLQELQPLLDKSEGEDGRMVCRCEQVEEAAIRDAMSRGITLNTVDTIKRRCRPGAGSCQGAFCRPRTAALMSNITGQTVTPETDPVRSGLRRVSREEMLDYVKEQEEIHKT